MKKWAIIIILNFCTLYMLIATMCYTVATDYYIKATHCMLKIRGNPENRDGLFKKSLAYEKKAKAWHQAGKILDPFD